jgi:casein kinase II subunit beta
MRDEFNLAELSSRVPFYTHALSVLLDVESETESDGSQDSSDSEPDISPKNSRPWISGSWDREGSARPSQRESRSACKLLYTLIHARYLLTRHGLAHMADRYEDGFFGTCPRYFCSKTRVIPTGLSDTPGQARMQVYCPSCNDVYQLPSVFHRVDGAAFGTSFPHVFFKAYPEFVQGIPGLRVYEPKIYGFKLYRKPLSSSAHHKSRSGGGLQIPVGEEMPSNLALRGSGEGASSSEALSFQRGTVLENMTWIRLMPNYNRI